jgi:hypothetical protein
MVHFVHTGGPTSSDRGRAIMSKKLEKYLVEIAIRGINKNIDTTALEDFDFDLGMRPHILNKSLYWDNDANLLIAQVEVESPDEKFAANLMWDELFEVANAVLQSIEGLNVKILQSRRIDSSQET